MKASWGKVITKDGGGSPEQLILEVTTGAIMGEAHVAWAYLTKAQAKDIGNRLLKFAKK